MKTHSKPKQNFFTSAKETVLFFAAYSIDFVDEIRSWRITTKGGRTCGWYTGHVIIRRHLEKFIRLLDVIDSRERRWLKEGRKESRIACEKAEGLWMMYCSVPSPVLMPTITQPLVRDSNSVKHSHPLQPLCWHKYPTSPPDIKQTGQTSPGASLLAWYCKQE